MRHEGNRIARQNVTPITRAVWPSLVEKRRAEIRAQFVRKNTWAYRDEVR